MLQREKRDEIASHILAFYNFKGHIVKNVSSWRLEENNDLWSCDVIIEYKDNERLVPFWIKFVPDTLEVEYVKAEEI